MQRRPSGSSVSASPSWDGLRRIWSASTAMDANAERAISFYGALQRTHSNQSLSSIDATSRPMSRGDSFQDLPHVALAGLGSRVSIRGSTSESADLERFFRDGPTDDVTWVVHEGGWTCALQNYSTRPRPSLSRATSRAY